MPPQAGQSVFGVSVRAASDPERAHLERQEGLLASDACVLVRIDGAIVGWGDDYGTYTVLSEPRSITAARKEAGEALLAAATDLWEAEAK